MSAQQDILYEYDPTGQDINNLKRDEEHQLTPENGDQYHVIVPDLAPFYREGLVVSHENSSEPLTQGVDYILTHQYTKPDDSIGSDVFGSITFLKRDLSGTIVINSYQVLGGPHLVEGRELLAAIGTLAAFPDVRSMADVIGLPDSFPPVAHVVDGEDLTDLAHLIDELRNIREAITGEYQANHLHTIDQVIGLSERIALTASNAGNHKHAPALGYNIINEQGSVGVLLPRFQVSVNVLVEVLIMSENQPARFYFSGRVNSQFQSQPGQDWLEMRATFQGHEFTRTARFTYDEQNHPIILLGNNDQWRNCHVVITSATIDTTVPQNYVEDWGVYVTNTVTGTPTRIDYVDGLDTVRRIAEQVSLNSILGENVFDPIV